MKLGNAPSWVPASGHALRHAGIHFDAVRIAGALGEEVAFEIMQLTDFHAGPIVRESTGEQYMYFLLPPQSTAAFSWPACARALSRNTRDGRSAAFVGVPALEGLTWPLDWRSRPSIEVPFVELRLLHETVMCAVR
ncbi:hypothetical protein ACIHCQ_22285 [Streptomyces sp. NPDC052236]|uniref:hypothetical protein n=1 Tax=Streptomyces sp. NPDC052236 TaxID=3365686 RepID=UPI0037CEB345